MLTAVHDSRAYLAQRFAWAEPHFEELCGHCGTHGRGQVYTDVLIVKFVTNICTQLGITMGSHVYHDFSLPDGRWVSLAYDDILSWLGISEAAAARSRTVNAKIEKTHAVLSEAQDDSTKQLTGAEEALYLDLSVLIELNPNQEGPFLLHSTATMGRALTNAQRRVIELKRKPFVDNLDYVYRKHKTV